MQRQQEQQFRRIKCSTDGVRILNGCTDCIPINYVSTDGARVLDF
jgi:hypothetical protein